MSNEVKTQDSVTPLKDASDDTEIKKDRLLEKMRLYISLPTTQLMQEVWEAMSDYREAKFYEARLWTDYCKDCEEKDARN